MVVRFGMSEALGQATYEAGQATYLNGHAPAWHVRNYSDATAHQIDLAVKELVNKAFRTATEILERNRDILESAASQLLAHEALNQNELAAISTKLRGSKHRNLAVVS
jgi:cell division protease FtsH